MKTPLVYRDGLIDKSLGHPSVYVGLIRHGLRINREVVGSELEQFSQRVDPQDQLHLVEGLNARTQENNFLRRFSRENKVKVIDPIVNPFQMKIAEKVYQREVAPLAVLVLDYLGNIGRDRIQKLTDNELEEFFDLSLDTASRAFGVSKNKLKSQFLKLNFDDPYKLLDEMDFLSKARRGLIEESNSESRIKVSRTINQHPNKYVFAMSGASHTGVFAEDVSLDTPKLKGNLKLFKPDRNISPLRQKLLAVQNAIDVSGEVTLAGPPDDGSMPSDSEWSMVGRIQHKLSSGQADWSDFVYLMYNSGGYYSVFERSTSLLASFAEHLTPNPLPSGNLYLNSPLMEWSLDCSSNLGLVTRFFHSYAVDEGALNSAKTLRIILKKIGETLPDEVEVIKKLLAAPLQTVREQGAQCAYETSKHKWRYNSESVWGIFNAARSQGDFNIPITVKLALVSADPSTLFATYSDTRQFAIYDGKRTEYELRLIECAIEESKEIRNKAFSALAKYLERHQIDLSQVVDVLVRGIQDKDDFAFVAASNKFRHGISVTEQRLLPPLITSLEDSDAKIRVNGFYAVGVYLEYVPIPDSANLKVLCRKNFSDALAQIRINATDVFGKLLSYENPIQLDPDDISVLMNMASTDNNEYVRLNSSYSLAEIFNKDPNLFTLDQLREVEYLCTNNRNPQIATSKEIATMDQALSEIVKINALRDLQTLLTIKGHESEPDVTRLIREKDRYRDAIRPLWDKIERLHKANEQLVQKVAVLSSELAVLNVENTELKLRVTELSEELESIKARSKNSHVYRLASTLGRTVVRNVIKQRGVLSKDTAQSAVIDTAWDEGLSLIANIGILGLGGFFGIG